MTTGTAAVSNNAYRFICVRVHGGDLEEDVRACWQWFKNQWRNAGCQIDGDDYCQTALEYWDGLPNSRSNPTYPVATPGNHPQYPGGNALWEQQCCSIRQYIKPQDQYMALVSLLLKSRAFHETVRQSDRARNVVSNTVPFRPIIVLPRTRYNQPFIPWPQSTTTEDPSASPVPFSISHQYPLVGMVQQLSSSDPFQYCGLDIVIFDPFNESLYSSTMEFMAVFQDLFSPREWNYILQCHKEKAVDENTTTTTDDHLLLREFYIRWSMKEAYTKAFGRGMNFNFASFETIRIVPAAPNPPESVTDTQNIKSLYRWMERSSIRHRTPEQRPEVPLCAIGTVTQLSSAAISEDPLQTLRRPETEEFWFFFYPFYEQNITMSTTTNIGEGNDSVAIDFGSDMIGCACVCVGPLVPLSDVSFDRNDSNPRIQVEWTSLHQLCTFHTAGG
jgi:phosphopantetheinyl transferase (holo-ACP synthase)